MVTMVVVVPLLSVLTLVVIRLPTVVVVLVVLQVLGPLGFEIVDASGAGHAQILRTCKNLGYFIAGQPTGPRAVT